MAKFIDKILLALFVLIIFSILLFFINIPTYIIILFFSLLFSLFVFFALKNNNKYKQQLSYRDFIIECIKNEDYLISFISEELYPNAQFKKYDFYFVLNNEYYFLNIKFSPINYENLINFYKQAKKININKVNIITTIKDRKVFNLFKYLDMNFSIMDLHPIYKKLKKLNLLKKERSYRKYNLPIFIINIFKKSNIKLYLLSSIFLFIMSYITLFKTYYLIFAIALLLLSLISIIINIISESKSCL